VSLLNVCVSLGVSRLSISYAYTFTRHGSLAEQPRVLFGFVVTRESTIVELITLNSWRRDSRITRRAFAIFLYLASLSLSASPAAE